MFKGRDHFQLNIDDSCDDLQKRAAVVKIVAQGSVQYFEILLHARIMCESRRC